MGCYRANAEALVSGLQELRTKGLLCDVALTDGETRGRTSQHLAHQVVLAAASRPLRNYFLVSRDESSVEHLPTPPRPQELRLNGLGSATTHQAVVSAALGHIYGSTKGVGQVDAEAASQDLSKLSSALGLSDLGRQCSDLDAESLVHALNDLRAEGSLCDMVLVAGGKRFTAHQAVLAAAGGQLRKCVLDRARELADAAYGGEAAAVASKNLELELPGICHAEALATLLDYVYANPKADPSQKPPAAVAWEVAQLAQSLGLTKLREQTCEWLGEDVTMRFVDEPAAAEDQQGQEPMQVEQPPVQDEEEDEDGEDAEDAEDAEEEAAEEDEEEEAEDGEKNQRSLSEVALEATQCCRYADTKKVPSKTAVPADITRTLSKRQEARIEKLRALFDERPAWLQEALQAKLPTAFEEDQLEQLLPFVAYQWVDGPWQRAYVRFGFDPRKREHAEEAKMLQVLVFRDPYFATLDKKKLKELQDAPKSDPSFKGPPSKPQQHYQLVDIKDDFVSTLCVSAEVVKICCKASGWFEPEIMFGVREALGVRSARLRERQTFRVPSTGSKRTSAVSSRGSVASRRSSGASATGRARAGAKVAKKLPKAKARLSQSLRLRGRGRGQGAKGRRST